MIKYFETLTGANCLVGEHTIISLNVTEDMDADYDTASAVCLAPGGPYPAGEVVETIEGGVSTGSWVVDDGGAIVSGKKTWRRRSGELNFAHLPLVAYRLRRKGYLQARATMSKVTLGKDNFPPKLCTVNRWEEIKHDIQARIKAGTISHLDAMKERDSWHPVAAPSDIILTVCAWVGLPVAFAVKLTGCAEEYLPVGKTALGVCKEVASWSGATCHLSRAGTLVVYDWVQVYGQGSPIPMPPSILECEERETLFSPTQVTVVGKGYRGIVVNRPADPGHWSPGGDVWRPAQPAVSYISGRVEKAVEVTESLGLVAGAKHVEERIEINNYPINPQVAQAIARERLTRAALQSVPGVYQGPAEGCQEYAPVTHRVFSVNRTLAWNGKAYRYETTITGPRGTLSWGPGNKDQGWW